MSGNKTKQNRKLETHYLQQTSTIYFPVQKHPSHWMCWWKMDWMFVSQGGCGCQSSMYIIWWHVCANALCMMQPGLMQHSASQGGRRWGQHSLQPKMLALPSVCGRAQTALSQLAGGSTHLETQLGGCSRNCLSLTHTHCYTRKRAPTQRGSIPHKSYVSTWIIEHM